MAVFELGMNHAGEIRTLVGIAEPEVRVWTNVGDAHLGFFASSDAIADAKAEILEGADASTLLVCSADDSRITSRRGAFPGRTVTFGEAADAHVRATDIEDRGLDGTRATVVTGDGQAVFETPLLGRANLANVLAATAVATACGVPLEVVRDRVARVGPADRRGMVRRLRDDVVVIDDSYNSSPAALTQALRTLAAERRAPRPRRRARRDAGAGRARRVRCTRSAGARRPGPDCARCSPSAASRRAAWPARPWTPACPRPPCTT